MEIRLDRLTLQRPACDNEDQNPGKDLGGRQQWAGMGKGLTYWTIRGVVPDRNWIGVSRLARVSRELPVRSLFDLRPDRPELGTGMNVSLNDEKLYGQRKERNRKQQRIGPWPGSSCAASPPQIHASAMTILDHPRRCNPVKRSQDTTDKLTNSTPVAPSGIPADR